MTKFSTRSAARRANLAQSPVSSAVTPTESRRVVCRQIEERDLDALAILFSRAFKSRALERRKLALLTERDCPVGFPRYGYLLDNGSEPVGAILLIVAGSVSGDPGVFRCSVSNWYVRPDYHAYSSLLVSRSLNDKRVTYVNASARAATWPIIEAQSFRRISQGVFISVPSLAAARPGLKVARIERAADIPPGITSLERDALLEHSRAGCFSFVGVVDGVAMPVIIGRRPLLGNRIPAGHLIYARSYDEFVSVAGTLGRRLLAHAIPIVLVYGNGPIDGLPGRYFDGRMPKFARGPNPPPATDFTYTNIALFNAPEHIRLLRQCPV